MNNNSMFSQNQNWSQTGGNQSQNNPSNPLELLISQYLQNQQQTMQKNPQTSQIPVIPGRIVMNEEEIKANEIPMDGTPALFIKNDFSCVWSKTWNSNGSINTSKFVLEQAPVQNTSSDEDFRTQIFNRLDKIDATMNAMASKSHYQKPYKGNKQGGNKPKQEVRNNE